MNQPLTVFLCPRCGVRFALELGREQPAHNQLSCPACGLYREGLLLLAPEEWEVWELWRGLSLHLDRLPEELRAPLDEWTVSDGPTPKDQGLLRAECAECGTGAWLPTGAGRCPVCRGTMGLRRAS
ncbi:MAG: hypothetical protein WC326_14490 [Candidatus Delongbacteria bacterium]